MCCPNSKKYEILMIMKDIQLWYGQAIRKAISFIS